MLTVGPVQIQGLQLELLLPMCCLEMHCKSRMKMKDLEIQHIKRRDFLDQQFHPPSVMDSYII